MLFFIRHMNKSIKVKIEPLTSFEKAMDADSVTLTNKDIMVYSIQGPWFFGVAEKIIRAMHITHTQPTAIILRLGHVPFIDMTGLAALEELLHQYHHNHVKIYLCEANPRLCQKINQQGMLALIEDQTIFPSFAAVVKKCQ